MSRDHSVFNYLKDIGIRHVAREEATPAKREALTQRDEVPQTPVATRTTLHTRDEKAQALADLRAEIGDCTHCALAKGRTTIVFGDGNPDAEIMFIGEAPGQDEDLQGLPFVGKAGQLLTKMIVAMGYTRADVYIANVNKCRPPNNRTPEPEEIAACKPFLKRQIEIIQPKVIVCLGGVAAQGLLNTDEKISRLRGAFRRYDGIPVMATYHPAYLLRSPEMKKPVWEDLKQVMALVKE